MKKKNTKKSHRCCCVCDLCPSSPYLPSEFNKKTQKMISLIVAVACVTCVTALPNDFGHEIIYRTHGVDPASVGFQTVPKNLSYHDFELKWNGKSSIPSFLNGTFYRGAPGQWPDGYWLDGLITLNAFSFPGTSDGKVKYTMQYTKDDAFNGTFVPPAETTSKGTLPHPENSSFPTGVSFRRVNNHLLTTTGVTNSNEVDPHTLRPISMPFRYDDDLSGKCIIGVRAFSSEYIIRVQARGARDYYS